MTICGFLQSHNHNFLFFFSFRKCCLLPVSRGKKSDSEQWLLCLLYCCRICLITAPLKGHKIRHGHMVSGPQPSQLKVDYNPKSRTTWMLMECRNVPFPSQKAETQLSNDFFQSVWNCSIITGEVGEALELINQLRPFVFLQPLLKYRQFLGFSVLQPFIHVTL